jgi:sugar phosphate isomerase/epimerase
MQLGIFAKTFARPTLEAVLDAVRAHGLDWVQFNLACAGLPALPDRLPDELCDHVREALAERGITMAAVSGTFNMAHPDPGRRADGLRRLRELARGCRRLGTSVITLCTGTRDPDDMWRRHPDNDSPQAWRDLLDTLRPALDSAEEHGVTLAFEPEVANVVDSARKGRRLLDELGSPRLKVVMDAANLFHAGELARMREVLDEALALLGGDVVLAHAKDLLHDGEAGHEPAGKGLLDYDDYLRLLHGVRYGGPLILHGLAEDQVAESVAFLRGKLARLPSEVGEGARGGSR